MKLSQILLSGIFVTAGFDSVKEPGGRVQITQDFMADLGIEVSHENAELMVRANGAVMVGAGAALALGIFPKLSALGLVGALVPTTLAGHPFWKSAPEAKGMQQIQFFKNLAAIGGLVGVLEAKRKH
ncbi:DoxX family protein [Arcanobacterium phocisimile]|nr:MULTISPECIES: DoxX family protein [Arcanobacterium]QRV02636.1 DoxX family protein [Arcanobacterium phocisimile]